MKDTNDKPYITPFKDLMDKALKDYDEASKLAHHFNSDIPKAIIKFYTEKFQPVEPQEERIPNVGKTIELREELVSFAQQFYADEETCIHNVDQYLTSKKHGRKDNDKI